MNPCSCPQTDTLAVDSVDSAATFNAEPTVKDAYEKGYGVNIGVTVTVSGVISYKTGCSVNAFAADVRRNAMNVQYNSVVSVESGVDPAAASQGVTDTSAFATAVANVLASDTTTYSSVTPPSASDMTSVGTASAVTIEGGTTAPTSSGDDSDDIEVIGIILIVVAGIVFIGMIIVIVCKLKVEDPEINDDKRFIDVATEKQASTTGTAQPRQSFDETQPAVDTYGDDHSIVVNTNDQSKHSEMEMQAVKPAVPVA